MSNDPICTICGEPKSAHVATTKGPFTHPREARGEGTYIITRGGYIQGRMSPADDDLEVPPHYEFFPNP
jgi:hypothetical protein